MEGFIFAAEKWDLPSNEADERLRVERYIHPSHGKRSINHWLGIFRFDFSDAD